MASARVAVVAYDRSPHSRSINAAAAQARKPSRTTKVTQDISEAGDQDS